MTVEQAHQKTSERVSFCAIMEVVTRKATASYSNLWCAQIPKSKLGVMFAVRQPLLYCGNIYMLITNLHKPGRILPRFISCDQLYVNSPEEDGGTRNQSTFMVDSPKTAWWTVMGEDASFCLMVDLQNMGWRTTPIFKRPPPKSAHV